MYSRKTMLVLLVALVLSLTSSTEANTKLTKFIFYHEAVPWNLAKEVCTESGGRLVEPNTLSKKEIVVYYSVFLSRTWISKLWIGVINKTPGQQDFVLADSCESVDRTKMEITGSLPSNLCVILSPFYTGLAAEPCSELYPFMCEKISGDCSYVPVTHSFLEISGQSIYISEIISSSSSECAQTCDTTPFVNKTECWAYAFNTRTNICELKYSSFALIETLQPPTITKPTMVKRCYEGQTANTSISGVGSHTPNVQCVDEISTSVLVSLAQISSAAVSSTTPTTKSQQAVQKTHSLNTQGIHLHSTTNAPQTTPSTNFLSKSSWGTPGPGKQILNPLVPPTGTQKCRCYVKNRVPDEDVLKTIHESLLLKRSELSSVVRRYISVHDSRSSATAIGFGGIVFLVIATILIMTCDILSVWQTRQAKPHK